MSPHPDPAPVNSGEPTARRLRAMKWRATALLVGVAAGYVIARIAEPTHPAIGYLRAFCEAAMVGGLADWFAVTALFRHPLGVPLPHTAIVPRNKDRIGDALGKFVENNFLSAEVVAAKLADIDLAAVLSRWLADPVRSGGVAARIARLVPRIVDAIGDEPVRGFLHHNVVEGLKRIDLAPVAAELLESLTAQNRHQRLVDEALLQARRFLDEAEPEIRARVRERTAWLWQRLGVDEAISDRLINAAEDVLAESAQDPEHAWRQRFSQLVLEYVDALRHDPVYQLRVERMKDSLLEHPLLGDTIADVWRQVRGRIREDTARDDSRIRANLEAVLLNLGRSLAADEAMREALNRWLRELLLELVERRRHEVATLIADTVRRWDPATVTDRIERAIGRDLQYIRINGTVIGGLVGIAIHAVSQFLP